MRNIFAEHGLNCPVTHGLATRLSRDGFASACDAKRTRGEESWQGDGMLFFKICELCDGNHQPKELEIIDMPKKIGTGNCGYCGKEGVELRNGYNTSLCASCYTIHSHANQRAPLVLDVLTRLHGREYLAQYLGEPVPPQDNCAELEQALLLSQSELATEQARVDSLREELKELRSQAGQVSTATIREVASEGCALAPALLDLALGVIKGEITGLRADQIEALRGA